MLVSTWGEMQQPRAAALHANALPPQHGDVPPVAAANPPAARRGSSAGPTPAGADCHASNSAARPGPWWLQTYKLQKEISSKREIICLC